MLRGPSPTFLLCLLPYTLPVRHRHCRQVGSREFAAQQAIEALRELECALKWTPLTLAGEPLPEGAVFLKGNQRTGTALVRAESGLGVGILISGQAPSNADAEDTWGPLPLGFFG